MILALRFWHHNFMTAARLAVDAADPRRLNNREDGFPRSGKYNAGQKLLFFVLVLCLAGCCC